MGETTKIGWTDHTFNPWVGCSKISEGCKHCYAETMAKRAPSLVYGPQKGQGGPRAHLPVWGDQAPRRVTSAENWRQPLRWDRAAAKAGVRRRVFCASLADVFEDVAGSPVNDPNTMAEWRVRLWGLIRDTPHLDWLLLTKRPENVLSLVPDHWRPHEPGRGPVNGWPAHVWIGCTVENQARAAERLPHLLRIPAPVRFVSYEPALERVEFGRWLPLRERAHGIEASAEGGTRGIDWIIVGGESGPGARPFELAWARSVVAQGKAASVPVFVKQMGALRRMGEFSSFEEWVNKAQSWIGGTGAQCFDGKMRRCLIGADMQRARDEGAFPVSYWLPKWQDRAGADPAEWPEDLRVQQFPEARP